MPSALSTDLYELTMAVSYLRRGMTGQATFSLLAHRLPDQRGFLVAAGLADCIDYLASFRFSAGELAYIAHLLELTPQDRDRLRELRFTGEVWAVPEGRIVTAEEPILEVTAPIAEAQLVETALLNFISFQTSVASKAARCRLVTPAAQLVDYSMSRAQSLSGGMQAARAMAIGGFDATSNVAAARAYGLTVSSTMAHSYVEAFPGEREAFRAYAGDFRSRASFVVDTYDPVSGLRGAVDVIDELGIEDVVGIRLDGGDLAELALQSREILDASGLSAARIIASGGLDEYALDELTRSGAPIDTFGVGTKVGVSADAPFLDTAYKLVELGDRPVFKAYGGAVTLPGRKQVFRAPGLVDQIGLRGQKPPPGTEPLLQRVMAHGHPTEPFESVARARRRCEADLAQLAEPYRSLRDPAQLVATYTPELIAYAQEAGALPQPAAKRTHPHRLHLHARVRS